MAWERITWFDYKLHVVQGKPPPTQEIINSTKNGRKAKYRPGLPIEAIELSVFTDAGRFIAQSPTVRVFYIVEDQLVGWDNGLPTNIVRVEWGASPPGPVHGRPINERNLLLELGKVNRDEREFYKSLRKQSQHQVHGELAMKFINWELILPRYWNAEVVFSYLAYPPHCDTVNSNPVGIHVPGGMMIDVEWDGTRRKYTASLFAENDLRGPIQKFSCSDVDEVIRAVLRLGETARGRYNRLQDQNKSLSSASVHMVVYQSHQRRFTTGANQPPVVFVIRTPDRPENIGRVRLEAAHG